MNWLQNGASFVFTLAQDKKIEASFMMKVVENSIWIGIAACAMLGAFCGYMLFRRVKQKSFPGIALRRRVGFVRYTCPLESRDATVGDARCAAA